MAKTASLNIRVDPVAKLKAEKIYSSFGITLSDAVNMFIYKSIQCNGLPFELKSNVQITETELNKTPENREEAKIVENISEPIDVKSKIVVTIQHNKNTTI